MKHSLSKFRSTSSRPYQWPNDILLPRASPAPGFSSQTVANLTYLIDKHNHLSSRRCSQQRFEEHLLFEASCNARLSHLLEVGIFDVVLTSETKGYGIHGSRIVGEMKNDASPSAVEKSRLKIQCFADKFHGLLIHASIVWRSSHRSCFVSPQCSLP